MAPTFTSGAVLARLARALIPAVPQARTASNRSLGTMTMNDVSVAAWERVQEWTRQAADAARHNGTLYNHLLSISTLGGSGVWEAVRKDGPAVEADEDYRATRFVESLASLDLGRCIRRHETVGSHWLVPWPDKETTIRWDQYSTSELMLPIDPRRPPQVSTHRGVAFQPLYTVALPADQRPALIRVWRPDDEWSAMAWSPVASVLHHIEALHLMDLAEMALDRNRLASAGIMFIPNDIAGIDPKDPANSPTFAAITRAATTAISDPNSVSSVVPVFLTGPGDSGAQLRHLTTERRENPAAFQARRDSHLRELARALSSPAGRVLGNEDQAKYANAAAMEFDTLRTYLPAVTTDIVKAVNAVYREVRAQWGMDTRGCEVRLSFDHLQPKENRTTEALELRAVGAITMEGVAEMAQIPEQWRLMPDSEEYLRWQAEAKALAQPTQPAGLSPAPNGKPPVGYEVPRAAAATADRIADMFQLPPVGRERLHRIEADWATKKAGEIADALGLPPYVEPATPEQVVAALGLPPVTAAVPKDDHRKLVDLGDQAINDGVKVNLADVTIDGFHPFEGIGLARDEMPQLDGAKTTKLLAALRKDGIRVGDPEQVDPVTLLASQSELSAAKAREMSLLPNLADLLAEPILVSRDGYVLDGHHRYVAAVMARKKVTVIRIDLPIETLLERAAEFSGKAKAFTAAASPGVDWSAVLSSLAQIDRRLHDRISAAAEHAMETALRKAGVKTFNKATASQKKLVVDVPRRLVVATLGPRVIAALGIAEDDLLANALDDLEPLLAGYIDAAQAEGVDVIRRVDPTATAPAAAEWKTAALSVFTVGFLAAARDRLHNPDPVLDPRGELPALETKVPIRVINDTVARAGGVEPTGPDSVLIGGPGQGSILRTVAAAQETPPQLVYVWHHGSASRPFPPHVALDGRRWASMDDPLLVKDLTDPTIGWLPGTTFHPSDHAGCSCWVQLELDDRSEP